MIGPDDIGEKRQGSNTPFIALGVAVILLVVVVVISLNDFMKSRLEKEFEAKEKELYARYGYVPEGMVHSGAPGQQPPVNAGEPQVNASNPTAVPSLNRPPVPANPQLNRAAAQMGIEAGLPAPDDPEIEALRSTLDQARAEGQRIEERYNEISKQEDSRALNSRTKPAETFSQEGIGDLSAELPEFLREATANPPGGNPSVQEELERYRVQIRNAPSLGRVTAYDKEWGVVTFDAGVGQGVKANQRFAVRRGETILGWIKVDEVQEHQSIAILQTKNKNIDTAAKPEIGDDLIDFEIY